MILLIQSASVGLVVILIKVFFGCIMDADDLLILSSSLFGLQHMMDLCSEYAELHILYIILKSLVALSLVNSVLFMLRFFLKNRLS